MKYTDIAVKAIKGLDRACNMLHRTMLPSIWSASGKGWHEQWKNSPNCGLYASCQGLIVLNDIEHDLNKKSQLLQEVFCENLIPLFDTSIPVTSLDFKKQLQRGKAIDSSYKLAFFLKTATQFGVQNQIVLDTAHKLKSFMDYDGAFFATGARNNKSILATAIAYRALIGQLSCDDLEMTLIYLKNVVASPQFSSVQKVIALWALSAAEEKNYKDIDLRQIVADILQDASLFSNDTYSERYVLSNGMRDGYSINLRFVFVQAIIELTRKKALNNISNINHIVTDIYKMVSCLYSYGMFKRENEKDIETTLFWENYYAIQCVISFIKLINENKEIGEMQYMIINPKYFNKTDFTVEKKVAVIMPFSTEWSDKIYNIFCQSIPELSIWRSKEECTADAIMQTVWENINSSLFVIADCTGKNPNVFYELGIAHALGKPVFMCAQNIADIPFDINYIRSFIYEDTKEGLLALQNSLRYFSTTVNL